VFPIIFIIEGAEYDCAFFAKRPKFIHYYPSYLIINNIEFDHADIYDSIDQIKDGFRKLIRTMPQNSLILANGDSSDVRDVLENSYSSVQFFGKNNRNDWYFSNQRYKEKGSSFTVNHQSQKLSAFNMPLQGEHQIHNALGTIALCKNLGIGDRKIKESLLSFKGVKRRLELWGELNGALIYDDFAHHATAVQNILTSLKHIHPDKKLIAIYEPRTNTSVRNIFQKEITKALATADFSLIMPIHRIDRIPAENRLSLEKLERDIKSLGKKVFILNEYQTIWKYIPKLLDNNSVLVLLTNGNLGGEYQKLRNSVKKTN
jgi:UDP-N-acetylmuramate: L-alanyl-gamma-D-glutamyl-meso-diaminopimelate ligase